MFGDHVPSIPYSPIAELLAHYRARDPDKTAIVDLDSGSSITFGELDRLTTDIAALLKRHGVVEAKPRAAAVRGEPGEACPVVRPVADRRRGLPAQS